MVFALHLSVNLNSSLQPMNGADMGRQWAHAAGDLHLYLTLSHALENLDSTPSGHRLFPDDLFL